MAYFQEPARQPALRLPSAVLGLLLALIVAHVVRVLIPAERSDIIIQNYAFIPARYSKAYLAAHFGLDPGSLWDQAIPFVSYIFLHANFTHLGINCAWLLPFGAITARRFGALAFFIFFLICGAAGAATHLACNWGSADPVIGASAAIAGLMAAGFRLLPSVETTRTDENREPKGGGFAPSGPPMAPLLSPRILLWTALVLVLFVLAGVTGLGTGPGLNVVAWQAHIGGYLAGLVLAGPVDRLQARLRSPRRPAA